MTALDGLLEVLDDQTIGFTSTPHGTPVTHDDTAPPKLKALLSVLSGPRLRCKGAFEPYFDALLGRMSQHAFEAIDLNSPSLRECSMIFFGTLAKVYESEFVTYLPRVMPAVFASLGQAEEDDGSVLTSEMIKGFQPADDEEDEAEEDPTLPPLQSPLKSQSRPMRVRVVRVHQDSLLTLLGAVDQELGPLLAHFYPTTRKAAATTLLSFITVAHEITNPPKFEPGIANIHMPGDVRKLVDLIMPEIMVVWRSEDECDVVSDLCSSLSSVISTVGAGMVAPAYLDETCSLIIAILERKSPAQLDGDFDDASATAFGQFLPCMAKYYDPCFSPTDRNNAIGSLAEVINGLGAAVGPFTEQLLPLGLKATKDEDVEVRSNAAFFVGSLAYWTPVDISSQYLSILECLQPLFTVLDDPSREKSERAKDNAAGAIARMILKNKAALPLDQQDFAESSKCFEALFELIQQSHPLVEAHFEHILAVFAHVLQNSVPAVSEEKAMIQRKPETNWLRYCDNSILEYPINSRMWLDSIPLMISHSISSEEKDKKHQIADNHPLPPRFMTIPLNASLFTRPIYLQLLPRICTRELWTLRSSPIEVAMGAIDNVNLQAMGVAAAAHKPQYLQVALISILVSVISIPSLPICQAPILCNDHEQTHRSSTPSFAGEGNQ
ncbi:hypothetical protein H4Q26_010280 [Puccinia striiformis f. sp. tritici PST-130]|nr:hypothetical protein H4Q26_010280 [Puccinia striiformis f. sp. tritici PST-130]